MGDPGSPSYDARLLLEGERVEVRQKEKGLRGSWHPATIVGLKPGRRVVEYDELLTEDGLCNLRESIPLTTTVEIMRGSACRTSFTTRQNETFRSCSRHTLPSPRRKSRGFLRPLPPPCTEPSPQDWKKGFLVDVFFQDAWWEAVLLDDVSSQHENSLINVLFPDEGDQEKVLAKNLRISQDWNEETGQWNVKGKCNLSELLKRRVLRMEQVDSVIEPGSNCSEVVEHQNISASDAKVKDCRVGIDQRCPASSHEIEGREAGRPHSIQGAAADILHIRGIEGMLLEAQEASVLKQPSISERVNEEESICWNPVELTCLESTGGVLPSHGMSDSGVLSGVGDTPGMKEEGLSPGLALRGSTVIEDGEPLSHLDGHTSALENCSEREETNECFIPFKAEDIKSKGRQGGREAGRRQGEEPYRSSLCIPGTSSRECANGIPQAEVGKSGLGLFQKRADLLAKTDCSLRLLQQGGPSTLQQLAVHDEAETMKKRLGRSAGRRLGRDTLERFRAISKEERLRRALMGIEMPSLKGKVESRKRSAKLKTKDKDLGQGKGCKTVWQGTGNGSTTWKEEVKGRSGKLHGYKEQLTVKNRTGAPKDKSARTGAADEKERSPGRLIRTEEASGSCKMRSKSEHTTLGSSVLKNMVRDIAKVALQEAGFRIEFRQRQSKDYQDAVYVSPQGGTYWSLPNAWRAWKRIQAGKPPKVKTNNTIAAQSFLKGTFHSNHEGEGKVVDQRQASFRSSRGDLCQTLDQDILLQSALEKAGKELDVSQEEFKQLRLTNSQWTDLFVEDLGVLKRVTKKGKSSLQKQPGSDKKRVIETKNGVVSKSSKLLLAGNVAEGRGKKRKRDSLTPMEKANKKVFSGRHSLNRERPECGAIRDKSQPHNKGFVLKKDGNRVLSGSRPPVKLGKSGLLVKRALIKVSSKKYGAEDKKPLSKQEKSGKCPKSDGQSDFDCEPLVKKFRANLKEKTLPDNSSSKKQSLSRQDSTHSSQLKAKKNKQVNLHRKKGKDEKVRSGLRLEVRATGSRKSHGSESSFCSKQTILSWMMDRGALLEKEKVCYMDGSNNQVLKEGLVMREGIVCSCCKKIYTIHSFEEHAGSHAGVPGQIIFSSGRSLLDSQLQAWATETQFRKTQNYVGVTVDDSSDDTCLICGDGGDLLCCDHCPSTFHTSCLQLQNVPEGDWNCPKCSCAVCGGVHCSDKEKNLATDKMVLCRQCERRYHISCLNEGCFAAGNDSFCVHHCQKIFEGLSKLVGIKHALDGGLSWTLLRCMKEDWESQSSETVEAIAEQHSKLAVALLVMEECFVPMDDPRTNINMIAHALYNRWSEFHRLNYGGFYTTILEREGEIISVASIRVHGALLAEMPLIGTREQYRRQGMCRLLVSEIEKTLSTLGVGTFVLPAIPELLETWTHAFGFQPLGSSQRLEYRNLNMMVFPGTQLLQKALRGSLKADIGQGETQLAQMSDLISQLPQNVLTSTEARSIRDPDEASACKQKQLEEMNEEAVNSACTDDPERDFGPKSHPPRQSAEKQREGLCIGGPLHAGIGLDRHISHTYGRKRRKLIIDGGSPLGIHPEDTAPHTATSDAIITIDNAERTPSACFILGLRNVLQDGSKSVNPNVKESHLHHFVDQTVFGESHGCVVLSTNDERAPVECQMLCNQVIP